MKIHPSLTMLGIFHLPSLRGDGKFWMGRENTNSTDYLKIKLKKVLGND